MGCNVNPPTKAWSANNVPPINGKSSFWVFTWNWSYNFTCSDATSSACQMCHYVEIDYVSPVDGKWYVAFGGIINGPSDSGNCNQGYTKTYNTTYPAPYKAGTTMRAIWYFAPLNPSISTTCNGQDYVDGFEYQWDIPPDGP